MPYLDQADNTGPETEPILVINALRETDPYIRTIFMEGSCYRFFLFLKSLFPSAIPVINQNCDHVAALINGNAYDIDGVVEWAFRGMDDDDIEKAEKWSFGEKTFLQIGECPVCEEPLFVSPWSILNTSSEPMTQDDLLAALDAKADAGDHLCRCAAGRIREQEIEIECFKDMNSGAMHYIESLGHSKHCACRLAYGDGECECDMYEKGYDPHAWMRGEPPFKPPQTMGKSQVKTLKNTTNRHDAGKE